MLSLLTRLIISHRDIMQQQQNYESLLLYPGLLVACSITGKYTQIYNTRIVLSFINCQVCLCPFQVEVHCAVSLFNGVACSSTTVVGCNFGCFSYLCMYTAVLIPEGMGTGCMDSKWVSTWDSVCRMYSLLDCKCSDTVSCHS